MNKQEVFDKVKKHLLTQNKKSLNDYGSCMYRTSNGLKCAIGCLIPDDKYHLRIEHRGIDELLKSSFLNLEELLDIKDKEDFSLLKELQMLHDNTDVEDWKEELKLLADRKNLIFNEV
jgi:hypothetical protein